MTFYLSTETVKAAYEELTCFDYTSPTILHHFFVLKAAGFNSLTYENVSKISTEGFLPAFKISSLFSPTENAPEEYSFIYPFQMRNWAAKPPKESIKKFVSTRIKNNILGGATTWRALVEDLEGIEIRFRHDYLNEIAQNHLGNKIPALAFSIWAARFDEFQKIVNPREIIEKFLSEFNINIKEFSILFQTNTGIDIHFHKEKHDSESIRKIIGKPNDADNNWSNSIPSSFIQELDFSFTNLDFQFKTSGKHMLTTDDIYSVLKDNYQIILSGPPGTSKSFIANEIANEYFKGSYTKIQFHPRYSYQDFIGGHTVRGTTVSYEKGVMTNIIDKYKQEKTNHLLIIDEINGANVGQVFGEVIQLLDRDNKTQVRIDGVLNEYSIPHNIFIIATMNSADRSLGALDYAIRRRFSIIDCQPNYLLVSEICTSDFSFALGDLLRKINTRLFEILKNKELAVGHTLFLKENKNSDEKYHWDKKKFTELFNFKILPIIEEYCHGNQSQLHSILGDELPQRLSPEMFAIEAEKFINAA